jgi:probable rRNA maturation factor
MLTVDVEVEDESWSAAIDNVEALVIAAVTATLAENHEGEVSILLTDDASIRELNANYRGKDQATNVLSFPAAETARPHLGDIALTFGVCSAEATAQSKPLTHHLQHLVAHGALHLVGFDHQTDEDAEEMEALERQILLSLGISDPYALPDDRASEAH